jgi:hypothetical protein
LDVYLEWTNQDNLHELSRGESDVLGRAALEAGGYTVVICLVECRDVEGILLATKEREKVDGRHIPEAVIRTYNEGRARHFMAAVGNWGDGWATDQEEERAVVGIRALVETRMEAGSAGEGLVELSSSGLVTAEFDTEEKARGAIDRLRSKRSEVGVNAKSEKTDDEVEDEWSAPDVLEEEVKEEGEIDGNGGGDDDSSDDFHDAQDDHDESSDGDNGDGDQWDGVLCPEEAKKLTAELDAEKARYEYYEEDVQGLGYIFEAHDDSEGISIVIIHSPTCPLIGSPLFHLPRLGGGW